LIFKTIDLHGDEWPSALKQLFSELQSSTKAVSTVDLSHLTQSLELPLCYLHDGDLNAPMDADLFHNGFLDMLEENLGEVDAMMPLDQKNSHSENNFEIFCWVDVNDISGA
jgi:hypothetical protein